MKIKELVTSQYYNCVNKDFKKGENKTSITIEFYEKLKDLFNERGAISLNKFMALYLQYNNNLSLFVVADTNDEEKEYQYMQGCLFFETPNKEIGIINPELFETLKEKDLSEFEIINIGASLIPTGETNDIELCAVGIVAIEIIEKTLYTKIMNYNNNTLN